MNRAALQHAPQSARKQASGVGALRIGPANDAFEQEADQAAERINSSEGGRLSWSLSRVGFGALQRAPAVAHGSASAAEVPAIVHQALGSPGKPLDPATRSLMEPRFGHSFENVRVHYDGHAAESARAVNARAYTIGQHVVFDAGEYAPHRPAGRELIAHELAHVVQQSRSGSRTTAPTSQDSLEQSASSAAWAISNAATSVNVAGASAIGLAREARSLSETVDVRTLNDSELLNEAMQVQQWLAKNANTNDPASDHMTAALNQIEAEQRRRDAERQKPRNPLLPKVSGDSKQALIQAMQLVDSIKASDSASGLYTVIIDGEPKELNATQVAQVRQKAKSLLKENIGRVQRIADTASSRYADQSEIDKKHWIVAPIVKTLGRVKDPGPFLTAEVALSRQAVAGAIAAADADTFAQAAALFADAETSAIKASKLWQAYFEGIISAGEMTITALEITRDVAFTTLGVLATIATAGAAAGATSALGLEIGSAGAANLIATGAPIVASVGGVAVQVAMGDKVDWGAAVIDVAMQLLVSRFGGQATKGIAGAVTKRLAGKLAAESLARIGIEKMIQATIIQEGSTALRTVVESVYHSLRGDKITWEQFLETLIARLTDPKGIAVTLLVSAITTGAEAKYGGQAPSAGAGPGAGKAPPAPAAKAPPEGAQTPPKSVVKTPPVEAETHPPAPQVEPAAAQTKTPAAEVDVAPPSAKTPAPAAAQAKTPAAEVDVAPPSAKTPEPAAPQTKTPAADVSVAPASTKTPAIEPTPGAGSAGDVEGHNQARAEQVGKQLAPKIAAAEEELRQARSATAEYRGARAEAGENLKGGPSKSIWNAKERLWILKRQMAYPDRTILEQPRIVGVKTPDGKIQPMSEISGKGRTPDFVEMRGPKTVGGDLKSASELMGGIKGGIKSGDIAAEFRERSKIGGQHQAESKVIKTAEEQGGLIVLKGRNVLTGEEETIAVSAEDYSSEVLTYEDVRPN
jgi:Domain of unknown function (DUF4157)